MLTGTRVPNTSGVRRVAFLSRPSPHCGTHRYSRLANLLLILLLLPAWLLQPALAQTQPMDFNPPVIEMEEITSGIAGDIQVFTALVADDKEILDVKLYFRYSGQIPFDSKYMAPLGGSGYYTIKLETDPGERRNIEYYVQARDKGGNRTVKGFAFEPLVRNLVAPENPLPDTPPQNTPAPVVAVPVDEPTEPTTGRVRWWQVAMGVVAVGALAALAAGGSDDPDNPGNGDDNSSTTNVPLTITITQP